MRAEHIRPRPGGAARSVRRGRRPFRTIAAILLAGAVGLIPAVSIQSPVYAAPGQVTMAVAEIEGTEGDSLVFEIRRETPANLGSLPFTVSVSGGTATAGVDYQAPATPTPFAATTTAGDQLKRISVRTLDDPYDEANTEDFVLTVVVNPGPNQYTITGHGIIDDDDAVPTVNLSTTASIAESGGNATVTATLSAASSFDVSIPVKTTNATATAGQDYTALGGTATIDIAHGQTTGTIQIPIVDDSLDEVTETFTVSRDTARTLSPVGHLITGTESVTVNIIDNDGTPVVSVGGGGVAVEGTPLHFTVNLNKPSASAVTVRVSTTDGSAPAATAGSDYTARMNLLVTIPAGQVTATVDIATLEDLRDEATENIVFTAASPTNATLGSASIEAGISDDDDAPTATLAVPTVTETDTDTTATFTVGLDAASDRTATVSYTVGVNGSGVGFATAGTDFTAATGTLSFAPGDLTKTFNVTIKGDTIDEGTGETFKIALSNSDQTVANAGSIGTDTIVTLVDDDAAPTFSVADVSRAEGNPIGGVVADNAAFTVTLNHASDRPVDFVVSLTDGSAVGAGAGAGSDDVDAPTATVQIPALSTTATVNVPVNRDTIFEADETATLTVTLAQGETDATGGPDTSTLTLTNDDSAPSITLNPATGAEGGTVAVIATVTGVAQAATVFNLTLAGDSSGSNNPAEGSDFADTATQGTIPAGTASGSTVTLRTIALTDDTIDEPNEVIGVTVHDVAGNVADQTSTYTITDDAADVPPTVSIADASSTDEAAATVTVSLAFTAPVTATEQTVVVDYATADGTAVAGADYTAATGQVTFTPGQTSRTINVAVTDDSYKENDETLLVNLTSATPTGVTFTDASATVTVSANDPNGQVTFSVANVSQAENFAGTATFTVTLSAPSANLIDFDVTTADGTAEEAAGNGAGSDDYDPPSTTVQVPVNTLTHTFTVPVNGDTVFEGDETATVTVTLGQNEADAYGPADNSTLTLTNDDTVPTITLNSTSAAEGNTVNVAATLVGSSQSDTVFNLAVAPDSVSGNPAETSDYAAVWTTGTVPGRTLAGATVTLRTIAFNPDTFDEPDEFVKVTSTSTAGTLSTVTGVYTITDDAADVTPTVAVADRSVDESGGPATVNVSLEFSGGVTATERQILVDYTTADGSALAGSDYTTTSGQLTFNPGDVLKTVSVPITSDLVPEATETFLVTVTTPTSGVTVSDGSATVTVTDNRPTFSVDNVSQAEGNAANTATFTVTLSGTSATPVDFAVSVADGSAVNAGSGAGSDDYDAPSTTVQVAANQLTQTFTVPVKGDTVFEGNETATVTVALAQGETDATGPADASTLTLTNDDTAPTITLNSATAAEGSSVNVVATVTGVAQADVLFNLALTGDGSGGNNPAEGADYTAAWTQGTIPAGTASGTTLTLRAIAFDNDTIDEPDEVIEVTSTSTVGSVLTTTGHYTITDDPNDVPPTVAIADKTVDEAAGPALVDVSLVFAGPAVTATERQILVDYATTNGTAFAGSDYANTTGRLTFAVGDVLKTISVPVISDLIPESPEVFTVDLTSATAGVGLSDGSATVTITDNRPTFSVANVSQSEGDTSNVATFTVLLSAPSTSPVDFVVSRADGTAVDATAGVGSNDYDAPISTVQVLANQSSATFTVPVNGDTVFEADESATVTVALANGESDATGGADTSTLTLLNDDAAPTIALNSATAAEGNSVNVVATVTGVAQADVPFTLAVTGDTSGGNNPADAGDYTAAWTQGTIPAGTASGATVTLHAIAFDADTIDEPDEVVRVTSTSTLGTSSTAFGLYTITDDAADVMPTVAIADESVEESSGPATVDVSLVFSGGVTATERQVLVDYTTAGNGSAVAGSDYTTTTGQLTFNPGQVLKSIDVPIANDATTESSETFLVTITSATAGVTVSDGSATVTITENKPTFSVQPVTQYENVGAAVFTVTLQQATTQDVTFAVSMTDGTATDGGVAAAGGDDFDAPPTTLTILATQQTGMVTVPVHGDTIFEGDETAVLNVALAPGEFDAKGGPAQATLTLTNDDTVPTIVLNTESGTEGAEVAVVATVTGVAQADTVFDLTIAGDTTGPGGDPAEAGDYTDTLARGVIPGGTASGSAVTLRAIRLNQDTVDEAIEAFHVLVHDRAGRVPDHTAVYRINDDPSDLPPRAAIADQSVSEGSATAAVGVTLTFDPEGETTATERPVVVGYTTADGSAVAPSDYTVTTGSITINPGSTTGTITVPIVDDGLHETTEDLLVRITSVSPTGAVILDGAATVTIADNDNETRPTFSVAPVSVAENAGPATITVTLSGTSAQPVGFTVAMVDGTATDGGSAPGGDDFDAPVATLTIGAGQPSGTFTVPVNNDGVFEGAETATVRVSLASGEADALGGPSNSLLTITNDDVVPSIALNTQSGTEGTEVAVVATVTGVAQADTVLGLTVTGDSTGLNNPAEAEDYTDTGVNGVIPGGTASGSKVTLRTIRLNQDTVDEPIESIRVATHDLAGRLADRVAVYRINDDPNDIQPAVSIMDQAVTEGEPSAAVEVRLTFDPEGETTATERPIVVNYGTVNGTAVAPSDYTADSGSITINPGSLTGTITVPIGNDDVPEETEELVVRITSVSPTGTAILDGAATVTIADNDEESRPTFSVAPVSQAENAGAAVFTVTLAHTSSQPVDFTVGMLDGTATDGGTTPGGNDFDLPPTTVRVPANSPTATFSVPVNNDGVFEAAETATVRVALAAGESDALGGPSTALLTITDDDAKPSITLNTESGTEGTEVAVVATVTGVAQADTIFGLTVTGDSSGTNNPAEVSDFTNTGVNGVIPGGTPSGSTVTLRTIRLNQDTVDEPTEAIRVVTHDLAGRVVDREAVYRINDDPSDVPPAISLADKRVGEGAGSVGVEVTLAFDPEGDTTATERSVVVNYAAANGSAVTPSDYTGGTGSITIAPGSTTGTITIPIVNDTVSETVESFTVNVTSATPTGVLLARGSATVTIDDNDAVAPTLVAAVATRAGVGPVTLNGTTLAGSTVQLWAQPVGATTFTAGATTVADAAGNYTFTYNLTTGTRFYARANGLDSVTRTVTVTQVPVLTATSTTTGTATLTVTGNPKAAGQEVQIQRGNPDGTWTTVGGGVTPDGTMVFTATQSGLTSGATVSYRAYILANPGRGELAAYSAAKTVVIK